MRRTTLLLLPGMLNTTDIWDKVSAELQDVADIRVPDFVALDTMDEMSRAAWALADAKGPIAIAGFSMGGYVAAQMFAEQRDRVSRLAFIDTSISLDTPEQTVGRQRMMSAARADYAGLAAKLVRLNLHPDRHEDARLVATLNAMFAAIGPAGLERHCRAIARRGDHRAVLASARIPVAVICGREDRITPPVASEEIAAHIPGASLAWIDDAGHMTPLEQPAALAALLRNWLGMLSMVQQ